MNGNKCDFLTTSAVIGPIRKVAVIGAGPIGIATAKYLHAENFLETLDVYEQQASVGGVWIHTPCNWAETPSAPQTNPFQPLQRPMWPNESSLPVFMTPMYDQLDTNIPVDLMKFSDQDFPSDCPLFPPREDVLTYLEKHSQDVKHLIQFETQVNAIRLVPGTQDRWELKSRNLKTRDETSKTYDAIAVCSGHYTVPYIPEYAGLDKWHKEGIIMHSKFYRSPHSELFRGKKVLVIGNAASGMDIASQIAEVSLKPLLLSQRRDSLLSPPSGSLDDRKIKIVREIDEFIDPQNMHRSVRFINGSTENDIDVVLFATGYLYNYPFLDSSQIPAIDDGMRVKGMFQHLFHIDHPSLAMPGLPQKILPFPVGEAQAVLVARVWNRRLKLPEREKMLQWEVDTLNKNGDGRAFHTLIFPEDFQYRKLLIEWAGSVSGDRPPQFGDRAAWLRTLFRPLKQSFADQGAARYAIRTVEQLGYDFEASK